MQVRPKVVIWGASGHARVVASIVELAGEYEVKGLLDDINTQLHGSKVDGWTVLGEGARLDELRCEGVSHVIVGIGDCQVRSNLARIAERKGFQLARAMHPRAVIAAEAQIGGGTVIVGGAVVNPGAIIEANVIINTAAVVDHDCHIGNGAHVGPGARLGGRVAIGECAWIGIGATVIDRIRIGANSMVGAGALVTKDVPENVVVYGVPARVIRTVAEQNARDKRPQ